MLCQVSTESARNFAFCSALPVRTSLIDLPPHNVHVPRDEGVFQFAKSRRRARVPCAQASGSQVDLAAVRRAIPLSKAFRDLVNGELRARDEGEWMACCPFHDDRTPSLSISDTRQLFHCFGCGAAGDVIEMERRARNLPSLPAALASLADRYPAVRTIVGARRVSSGTFAPVQPPPKPRVPIAWGSLVSERRNAAAVLKAAVKLFRDTLTTKTGALAADYLRQRGVSDTTARAFQIGYAGPPDAWAFVLDKLRHAGFTEQQCVDAGLAAVSKRGTTYDMFRGRLVMPICDIDGNAIAVAGRLLVESDRAPKYVNSKESALFKKKRVLFGAHIASEALLAKHPLVKFELRLQEDDEEEGDWDDEDDETPSLGGFQFLDWQAKDTYLVIVEGYMDVISLYEHSNGTFPVVATMGTAVSVEQVEAALEMLPNKLKCTLIFNFDADDAGVRAAERLCDSVLSHVPSSSCIAIAFPPNGVKDVDQYLNDGIGTADDYHMHLKNASVIWTKWRGDRIIEEELNSISAESPSFAINVDTPESIQAAIDSSISPTQESDSKERRETASKPKLQVSGLPAQLSEKSEALFSYQVADELSRQTDRMMLAFGAPKDKIKRKYRRRKKTLTLECSPDVIEKLAQYIARTKRCLVGLNVSELVFSWADKLSGAHSEAIPALFDMIIQRMQELNKEWLPYSPEAQVKWMTPAPFLLDDLPLRERNRLLASTGRAPDGSALSIDEYYANTRHQKLSYARMDFQASVIGPVLQAQRCTMSRRFYSTPRISAEERVLRSLIFCTESQRLEALEKLLAVMMRVEEQSLTFWTALNRLQMFDILAAVEGDVTSEEIAAMCEKEDWWTLELEDIFLNDSEGDREWAEIMEFDRGNPVFAAEIAAKSIEAMEIRIRGRLAVDQFEDAVRGAFEAGSRGDFASMDDLMAQQILYKRNMRDARVANPEIRARRDQAIAEKEKEKKDEAEAERLVELLQREGGLPLPAHLRESQSDVLSDIE